MKTRTILLLVFSAIITLSFTFVSFETTKSENAQASTEKSNTEPVGGFSAEDEL